jgi:threonine/homoserine/homoserine lactone efflux protein
VIPIGGFVAVTVPLVLTPGASTAVVLRNSLAGGVRAGLVTALGVNSGSLGYGLLTAFGFALVLQRFPLVWTLLRVGGVAYLGWLGVQSLRRAAFSASTAGPTAFTPPRARAPEASGSGVAAARFPPACGMWRNLGEGVATNALNPAIATFYLVLLPHFIPRGAAVVRSALLLTAVHITLAGSWHVVWACAGGTLARTLAAGRPRQVLDALTGAALMALAIRIAVR